jgi:hypothetical protein
VTAGTLLVFARAAMCLTFALSAFGKARDLDAFVHSVRSFGILPAGRGRPAAWALLTAEVAVVVLQLAAPTAAVAGLVLAAALLVAYIAALGVVVARRSEVRCNCFGSTARAVSGFDLVRNGLLLLVAITGVVAYSAGSAGAPMPPVADAVLVVCASVAAVLVLVSLDDIAAILRTPPTNDD